MSAPPSVIPTDPQGPDGAALRNLIRTARGGSDRPLRIERNQGKLRVVLEGSSNPKGGPVADDTGVTAPEVQALLMRVDLKSHFDRCSNSRKSLPHLATLEHTIRKVGVRAFDELPLTVLRRAAGQLDGLAQQPVLEGFALLQARLDMAIVGREESVRGQARRAEPAVFHMDNKLQVNEISMSDFMRATVDPMANPVTTLEPKFG